MAKTSAIWKDYKEIDAASVRKDSFINCKAAFVINSRGCTISMRRQILLHSKNGVKHQT